MPEAIFFVSCCYGVSYADFVLISMPILSRFCPDFDDDFLGAKVQQIFDIHKFMCKK